MSVVLLIAISITRKPLEGFEWNLESGWGMSKLERRLRNFNSTGLWGLGRCLHCADPPPTTTTFFFFFWSLRTEHHFFLLSCCSRSPKDCKGIESAFDPRWVFSPPVRVNYIQTLICREPTWLTVAAVTVCAVLWIPCFLLPSDSSSLAGPQNSLCSPRCTNGIVRKRRGLYILTWMDVWGSFHFGWQGYSEWRFVPRLLSSCVSSSSAPLTGKAGQ